jgi:hypothetical protein
VFGVVVVFYLGGDRSEFPVVDVDSFYDGGPVVFAVSALLDLVGVFHADQPVVHGHGGEVPGDEDEHGCCPGVGGDEAEVAGESVQFDGLPGGIFYVFIISVPCSPVSFRVL